MQPFPWMIGKPLKYTILVFLYILFSLQSLHSSPESSDYSVKNGILDLRNWNPDSKSIIQLDGIWEFEPGVNHPFNHNFSQTIEVPGAWNQVLNIPDQSDGIGTGTYQIKILMPSKKLKVPLAFQFNDTSTAFILFINGVKIYENGKLGLSREEMIPSYKHPIVLLGDDKKDIDLRIEVSNFYHSTGGLRKSIQLGSVHSILYTHKFINSMDWMLFGASFLMGIYHLFIFYMRRIDKSALWFGFFCIDISMRTFFTGSVIAYETFDDRYWTFIHKLDIISYIIAIPLFTLFTYRIFQKDIHRQLINPVIGISFLFVSLVLFLPSDSYMRIIPYFQIMTVLLILYVLFIIGKVLKTKRDGAWLFFTGALMIFSTAINDMLNQALLIESIYMVNWGLMAFLFCQASLLSSLYSKAFTKIKELQILLEQKVQSRTQELELAKNEAEDANLLKDKFITHLTHDLRTPITTVINFLDHVIKGYDTLGDETKINYMYQAKVTSKESLNMIGILLNINHIKSNSNQIMGEEVDLFHEVNAAIMSHSEYLRCKKITINNLIEVSQKVFIDKALIKEVLSNLISNSIKLSSNSASIKISSKEQGAFFLVTVENIGDRLDESALDSVLKHSNKTRDTGTSEELNLGLGLPLISDIIESWNGTIVVESKNGEGVKICFTIPKLFSSN